MKKVLFLAIAVISFSAQAGDKSQYTIFNPTPKDQMRDFSTDRPDKTESAFTVDAGHFQFEFDMINMSVDDENGVETTETLYSGLNMKAGLTNNLEVQVIIEPKIRQVVKQAGVADVNTSAYGSTTLRIKNNIFGNDDGPVAMALMPYYTFQGAQSDFAPQKGQFGLTSLFAADLPKDWSTGFMFQVENTWEDADDRYYKTFIVSWTFGHSIYNDLSGYLEFYSESSSSPGSEWIATYDMGLTYLLNDNYQFDFGMNFGATDAAVDFNPFLGFSCRF